jgi:hypothetical protein
VACHPFPIPKIGEADMICSIKGFTFVSALDLEIGYYQIKLDADYWLSKAMYHCIPMADGKIQIQTLSHGYQDCLLPDVFQNVMSNLIQEMEYIKTKMLSWWFANINK